MTGLSLGQLPYRDFSYWRGPFELWVPYVMMNLLGDTMSILPLFYYLFTLLTFVFLLALAYQIFKSRLIFMCFLPVIIARTFPRISFYYWGGLRYALGLGALLCAVLAYKKNKTAWMFAAGIVSALSTLTTLEAGFSCCAAIVGGLILAAVFKCSQKDFIIKSLKAFFWGFLCVLIPVIIAAYFSQTLFPYIESRYVVISRLTTVLVDEAGNHPESLREFLFALTPADKFFKLMTPFYCYVFFFIFMWVQLKRRLMDWRGPALLTVMLYGIILYAAAFRMIWGHHFEMALQPEKILLFVMLEEFYFYIRRVQGRTRNRWQVFGIYFIIFSIVMSSWGYSITRFGRRFIVVPWVSQKLAGIQYPNLGFLKDVEKRAINIPRAKGMVVPVWQADEIEGVTRFLEKNTHENEVVLSYPEIGNFNYFARRPFLSRYPTARDSWMYDPWHDEFFHDLKTIPPRYVVMTKLGHRTFPEAWYFRYPPNKVKFQEVTQWILEHYQAVEEYESVVILKRNNDV